jgi:GTPase KRas protein
MADQWYKYANGFLLVYSITDRVSYENCLLLHQDILRVKDRPSVPIILISNKVRLPSPKGYIALLAPNTRG